MADIEDFDPFQVFEVEHKACMMLHVTVLCGRNISKGWIADLLDTPDPYVALYMRHSPDSHRATRHLDNDVNPQWRQTFTYFLDYQQENILEVMLMDKNYMHDDQLGKICIHCNELVMDHMETRTLHFNSTSEVDLELKIEFDTNPTLRYSLCLSDEEKRFRKMRRTRTMKAMEKLLGGRAPRTPGEVPTVGVLGSGGGFRAMVGFAGVFKALHDSGLLDCCTYTAALSGSSWYLSQLYSHPDWPRRSPAFVNQEIRRNINSSLLWLLHPSSLYRYIDTILAKRAEGLPVSFTDLFGHLIGQLILKGRQTAKLTDQQAVLSQGKVPMPLYTCVHVKKDVSARVFHEWVEFSPYEIGIPKYGIFMKSHLFGSKFFLGKLCKQFKEYPLHYLQGIWGSAFCILFRRLVEKKNRPENIDCIRKELERELDGCDGETPVRGHCDSNQRDAGAPSRRKRRASVEDVPFKRRRTDSSISHEYLPQPSNGGNGFWGNVLETLFTSSSLSLLSTRTGRAGVIHNPLRGLSLQRTYPFSPFTPGHMAPISTKDEFNDIFALHPTSEKRLCMVDAGLTFNSPYPLLLRAQRDLDIILSFDFSARPTDLNQPFKELLLAEKWAKLNGVMFPPINKEVWDPSAPRELYVFRHPTDPHCPVVLHFVLINATFRTHKKPGVPRKTNEEFDFADFSIFDDPLRTFSTFNFNYPHKAFDRLSQLTEFNTLLNVSQITDVIADAVERRRTRVNQRPSLIGNSFKLQPIKTPLGRQKPTLNSNKLRINVNTSKKATLENTLTRGVVDIGAT